MRGTRFLGAAAVASLLLGAAACGDDDDAADTTTTTAADEGGPATMEVTLTADGLEGVPDEIPAGLVEITLVNDSGGFGSFDISRVDDGTTEDDFVEGMAEVFEGGAFPEFFQSNVGVEADDGETATSLVVLAEGEHIAWAEPQGGDEGEEGEGDDGSGAEGEAEGEGETEGGDAPTDTSAPSTTVAEEPTTTTTTATGGEEEGAAGEPAGTLTAASAEDEGTEDEGTEGTEDEGEDGAGGGGLELFTETLTVTPGDADAELPEADGEIVASDYEFAVDIPGEGGTINFRNDGPMQLHHAVLMDFGTNDPDDVEAAFPVLVASEGDPSSDPPEGIDLEQVDFELGGSGVFGVDAAGTFEVDLTEGNTYVVACFIQDRTGGPPHALEYDMWEVFSPGEGETTETSEG